MNIPIALLTNFYQQIDDELKLKMENENFQTELRMPITEQGKIQPYFDAWLEKVKVPRVNKGNSGKILINSDYTRMSEWTYNSMFDPNQTIILSRSKETHYYGIPCENIEKYQQEHEEISRELVKTASRIFDQYRDHAALGNEFFQKTFLNRIPFIVKSISSSFQFYEKHNISFLVVGTTEDLLSRALAITGAIKGVKSICLQHGILMGEEAFMPVFTTKAGVYGEYEKKWYLNRGLSEDRIAAIGHPKYDDIFRYSPSDKKDFLIEFGLDPNKLTLILITGPNIEFEKLKKLIENIADDPKIQIIIKPHPWEMGKGKYGVYLELEKQYRFIKVSNSRKNNLYEFLSHSDGVISTLSTVVTESILFNKPVFIFNFMISNRTYDYYDQLGEFIQSDPDRLYQILKDYFATHQKKEIYNKIRNQYLSESFNDGSSGKKLINIIKFANKRN
ncbi:hypothetical protein GN156_16245 [bacterium LRH843]|nr:hypothetical protein [bacterium LRH843]